MEMELLLSSAKSNDKEKGGKKPKVVLFRCRHAKRAPSLSRVPLFSPPCLIFPFCLLSEMQIHPRLLDEEREEEEGATATATDPVRQAKIVVVFRDGGKRK